jgi:hypothetical protein
MSVALGVNPWAVIRDGQGRPQLFSEGKMIAALLG